MNESPRVKRSAESEEEQQLHGGGGGGERKKKKKERVGRAGESSARSRARQLAPDGQKLAEPALSLSCALPLCNLLSV